MTLRSLALYGPIFGGPFLLPLFQNEQLDLSIDFNRPAVEIGPMPAATGQMIFQSTILRNVVVAMLQEQVYHVRGAEDMTNVDGKRDACV